MRTARVLIACSALLVVASLLAPLIAYALVFGPDLSDSHQKWSEFGSFMGGIYTPILALCTLAVLGFQVLIQRSQAQHQFDQSFVEQSRADLEFYIVRLAELLKAPVAHGNSVRDALHAKYQPAEAASLRTPEIRKLSSDLHRAVPEIAGFWSAILPILQGLASAEHQPYKLSHSAALSKLSATLSFETCVALDNYLLVHADVHNARQHFEFSPLARRK